MNQEEIDLFKRFISPKCNGCSILAKDDIGVKSIMDYEELGQADILFVSDSLKPFEGSFVPFRSQEWILLRNRVRSAGYDGDSIAFSASVKCPNIKDDTFSAKDSKICRQHLEDTILKVKPKLVFACGKLATRMFYGKNTDEKKARGKPKVMEMNGHHFHLVSIIHPYQVIAEPKNAYLFELDITNNIESIILGIQRDSGFKYTPILTLEDLNTYGKRFLDTTYDIAVDIETTGLSFIDEKIQTIAFSVIDSEGQLSISIPIDHKENKMGYGFKSTVFDFIGKVLANPLNKKVLQNATFDLKFLKIYGIDNVANIWDTKIMQHLFREEIPKSLQDLLYYYFPNELHSV